ncbi:MAG: CDP-diacylglycerol--glycerol-3-phosphate 3-phosphatidyltransferase [Eubacteriales bacterium]|nr:CDP-diacylglycerol--glycerol-3-phosphate 3-phosphatidyltransferase [Eubacteriales bacterium]
MNLANKLTLLRMALIPVFIVFFYIDIAYWNYWAAGIFVIAALTDLFDGLLARKHNMVTNFGKLIDPIADKLLVCSALILLSAIGWIHPVFVIILVGREFVVSGLRAVAAAEGKVLAASNLGKAKTVVQIVAVVGVLLQDGFFKGWGIPFGLIMIWASVILSLVSCADYFIKNRGVLKDIF